MVQGKILITGGTGFIGGVLVDHLLSLNVDITLLIRSSSIVSSSLNGNVNLIRCSDWSRQGISSVLEGQKFQIVIHLASYGVNPNDRDVQIMSEINTVLPTLMVELAAQWGAGMIMIGSCSEYASPLDEKLITEDAKLEMKNIYGASKASGAVLACAAAEQLEVPLRILRLFNVYGAGESSHRLLPSIIKNLKSDNKVLLSAGTQVRDFIYVKDVIEAICYSVRSLFDGKLSAYCYIWNVSTGLGTSVKTFSEIVAEVLNKPLNKLDFGKIKIRKGEPAWMLGDPKKIHNDIGWKAKYDLRDGIYDVVNIYEAINR